MRLLKFNNFLVYFFSLFFISCNLISFSDEGINCSVNENATFYEGEYVVFTFSGDCNQIDAEDLISIAAGNIQLKLEFHWKYNILMVKPEEGWKKGYLYQLKMNGYLKIDGQNIMACIVRNFYFGNPILIPELLENTTVYPDDVKSPLILYFSKPIDIKNLDENIKIYPHEDFTQEFCDSDKSITIVPKGKWKTNTLYKIQIKEVTSVDGYHLKEYELNFEIPIDTELPELLKAQRYINVGGEYVLSDQEISELKGTDGLYFTFSKPMDLETIENGITINPYIEGIINPMDEEGYCFAFIPKTNYRPQQEYEIKIDRCVTDKSGLKLRQGENLFFIPKENYLEIIDLQLNQTEIDPNDVSINCYKIDFDEKKSIKINETETEYFFTITMNFSTVFDFTDYKNIVDKIKLKLKFPLTASNPYLKQVTWLTSNRLMLEYGNISLSTKETPVYYELLVSGGENGIKNSFMETMKKDLCIYIEYFAE